MAVDGAGLGPRLAGKVAFITGAGMGMGREAAVLFAEHGARIGVADINKAAAEETAALVERRGRPGGPGGGGRGRRGRRPADGRRDGAPVRRAARPLQQRGRPLEGPRPLGAGDRRRLVGAGHGRQPEVGLLGDQARHPAPPEAGGGSIVNVGSVSALVGFTRAQDAYTSAKGALISLTKSLAIQFAKDRIRCNIIHPGIVDTPLQAPYLTRRDPEGVRDRHPARADREAAGDRVRRALPRLGRVVVHDRGRARWSTGASPPGSRRSRRATEPGRSCSRRESCSTSAIA